MLAVNLCIFYHINRFDKRCLGLDKYHKCAISPGNGYRSDIQAPKGHIISLGFHGSYKDTMLTHSFRLGT